MGFGSNFMCYVHYVSGSSGKYTGSGCVLRIQLSGCTVSCPELESQCVAEQIIAATKMYAATTDYRCNSVREHGKLI